MQAHLIPYDHDYTDSRSKYNSRQFHSSTKHTQGKESNNIDSTFNIRYGVEDSF